MIPQGVVVLVTGATGALGRVVAAIVAEQAGLRLALTARRETVLQELSAELQGPGREIMAHAADLGDPGDVTRLIAAVGERWGGVDILLNTAGGWAGGVRVGELALEDWEGMLALNLRTAFLINRAVLPYMAERGWGRIVNVGSRSAEEPGFKQAPYNVAKAAVVMLTRSVARDYAAKGITANVVLPSIIDTPNNRQQMADADWKRWVPPEEIARLMLYLCSDEAASINGAAIPIYGRA